MITEQVGTAANEVFTGAKNDSIAAKILQDRMNPDPFQTLANALKTVSDSKSRVAAFFYKTEVLAREEYRCKVVLVPTNDISRTTFGFALSRNSSFYPYLS